MQAPRSTILVLSAALVAAAGWEPGGDEKDLTNSVDVGGSCLNLDGRATEEPTWCRKGLVCAAAGVCVPTCETQADCDLWPDFSVSCEVEEEVYPEHPKHCVIHCNKPSSECPVVEAGEMRCYDFPTESLCWI